MCSYTCFILVPCPVAEVGFEQTLYRVMEGGNGTEVNVSVCVTVFESDTFQLTDAVSLDYSLSSQPDTASGEHHE